MRAMIFQVAPPAPSNLSATRIAPATNVSLTLTDNSVSETGLHRSEVASIPGFATGLTTLPVVPPAANYGSILSFNDTNAAANTVFYYRAQAFSPNGTSAWSNTAQLVTGQVTALPAALSFGSTTVRKR